MDIESGGITTRETKGRHLGYVREFKEIIRDHPGSLRVALNLSSEAEDTYNPENLQLGFYNLKWSEEDHAWVAIKFDKKELNPPQPLVQVLASRGALFKEGSPLQDSETGVGVVLLGKASRYLEASFFGLGRPRRLDITSYFRMDLADQSFFVKKSFATTNPGFNEFSNSIRVKEALEDLDWLQVVEAQLGYSDTRQSWFVSKWVNLERAGFFPYDTWVGHVPNDYGVWPTEDVLHKFSNREFFARVEKLQEEMKIRAKKAGIEIRDLNVNLFYNPDTDKFFYLDVTGPKSESIGQEALQDYRPRF